MTTFTESVVEDAALAGFNSTATSERSVLTLPPAIASVAAALHDLAAPWAIAGGWAIDLALGRVTRPHGDIDVAVFRDDQDALHGALAGWELYVAADGVLVPWLPGTRLRTPHHEVHARRPGEGAERGSERAIELLLDEREGTDWVYRRDAAVRRPLERAIHDGPGGVCVLAPEIVLLYKSKAPRAADEHDFRVALPLLDLGARHWLRAAIRRADPEHPWAAALAPSA